MKRLVIKVFAFALIIILIQAILSIRIEKVHDRGFKIPFVNAYAVFPYGSDYKPSGEIAAIQKHQKVREQIGFLWKENVDTSDNVSLKWGDSPAGALCTDQWGFQSSPDAIAEFKNGRKIDIAGVGASYMGGAQSLFYEYFGLRGMYYYNFAHGRFTLPQFNVALQLYALPQKPKLVVYALNEVSYVLIDDFEKWSESAIDWFTFHSGTWCGPSLKKDMVSRVIHQAPYIEGMWNAVTRKMIPPSGKSWFEKEKLYKKVYGYILDAYRLCQSNGTNFVVLFIPSRETASQGPKARSALFDVIGPKLKNENIDYIDLRTVFGSSEDPKGLYFVSDSHWNRQGIYKAAIALNQYIDAHNLMANQK